MRMARSTWFATFSWPAALGRTRVARLPMTPQCSLPIAAAQ